MKKTLFTAAVALCSTASVVLGKTVSIDTTYEAKEVSTSEYSAFSVDFSNTTYFSEAPPINSQEWTLTSVTLDAPNAAGTKLAVYITTLKIYNSGFTEYEWSEFIGFSEVASVSETKATYTFTLDFNLTENTSYAFAFVSEGTEERSINKGTDLMGTLYVDADAEMLIEVSAAEHNTNNDADFMMYGAGRGNLERYIPVAAFTFSDGSPETPAIPEPATATLSLLALAGLAARRRRK